MCLDISWSQYQLKLQIQKMFTQVYGYYLWMAMDMGKVSQGKFLGRFVNAHGSPAISPVMTFVLRRCERGHVHILLIF